MEQFPKLNKSNYIRIGVECCETFDASNVGVGWLGNGRVGGTRQIDEGEVGFAHPRFTQVCAGQVRAGQARAGQVRARQVRVGQVRTVQVRAGQVRAG